MRKIAIEEIPQGGLELTERVEQDWFGPLVGPQFLPAEGPLDVSFSMARVARNVVVRGSLSGTVRFVCSRCAEEAPHTVSHAFVHVFVTGSDNSVDLPDDLETTEDMEFTFQEGDEIDLEPLAAEELVLSLPQIPVCSTECRGLCPQCGRNLNEGTCGCRQEEPDPRWDGLRNIKL